MTLVSYLFLLFLSFSGLVNNDCVSEKSIYIQITLCCLFVKI